MHRDLQVLRRTRSHWLDMLIDFRSSHLMPFESSDRYRYSSLAIFKTSTPWGELLSYSTQPKAGCMQLSQLHRKLWQKRMSLDLLQLDFKCTHVQICHFIHRCTLSGMSKKQQLTALLPCPAQTISKTMGPGRPLLMAASVACRRTLHITVSCLIL